MSTVFQELRDIYIENELRYAYSFRGTAQAHTSLNDQENQEERERESQGGKRQGGCVEEGGGRLIRLFYTGDS